MHLDFNYSNISGNGLLGPLAARLVALVTKFGWAKTGTLVLSKAMTSLKGPIKLVTAIFQLLFGKIGLIRNAITGLVTVFGILGGPITIVIGVIAALIAIFVLLWNKMKDSETLL